MSLERELKDCCSWAAVAGEDAGSAFVRSAAAPQRDTCMPMTPDAIHLSPSFSATDPAADAGLAEGLSALESYKKKDPTKGSNAYMAWHPSTHPSVRRETDVTRIVDRLPVFFSAVVVRFKAVGNAPIMKQNFFRVTVSNHFQAVIQFLRRELGWKAGDPLVSEHC
jgi:hypothetical protein